MIINLCHYIKVTFEENFLTLLLSLLLFGGCIWINISVTMGTIDLVLYYPLKILIFLMINTILNKKCICVTLICF